MLRSVTPSLQLVSQRLVALANQIALFWAREVLFQDKMAAELKQPVSQRATCVATKLRDKLQEKLPSVTAP